jgi:hypothetical protein
MFQPTRDQARETFFAAWRKYRAGQPVAGIEALALEVILLHPEYHGVLDHPDRYAQREYAEELNPFLHLSLHVALEEQLSIDQPAGIASRFQALVARFQDRHDALPPGARVPRRNGVARAARPRAPGRGRLS